MEVFSPLGENPQKNDKPHGGFLIPCVEMQFYLVIVGFLPSYGVVFFQTAQSETQPYGFLWKLDLLFSMIPISASTNDVQ